VSLPFFLRNRKERERLAFGGDFRGDNPPTFDRFSVALKFLEDDLEDIAALQG